MRAMTGQGTGALKSGLFTGPAFKAISPRFKSIRLRTFRQT